MRIVMLGHSGAGKTTYMASVYGAMQRPHGGFSLRAVDAADHRRFLALAEGIVGGTYPAGTDQRETYRFALRYRDLPVLEFDWADYRGGAILEREAGVETDRLRHDLAQADGIAVFCDADRLARGRRTASEMGRLSHLLGRALGRDTRRLPVVVVLTKRDCVKQIDDRILQWVDPMIRCVRASDRLAGAVVPVACGPRASQVPDPLLFILAHGITLRAGDLQARIDALTSRADELVRRGETLTGMLWDTFGFLWEGDGHRTHAQQAAAARRQARRERQVLEPLVGPARALGGCLTAVTRL